jgi:hypothetical protein
VFWQAADGTGAAESLTTGDRQAWPLAITPDGKRLIFHEGEAPSGGVDAVDLPGGVRPTSLNRTYADATLSPDGRWLAYQSNESGADQIYVRPFPNVNDGHWQVSADGGHHPAWSRSSRELFYFSGTAFVAVPVQTTPSFVAGTATKLFDGPYFPGLPPVHGYDVAPDGRFLMIKVPERQASAPQSIIVVLNWIEELKARVPAK